MILDFDWLSHIYDSSRFELWILGLIFLPETCKVILRSFGFVTCNVMMSYKSSELGGSKPEVENLNPMYYKITKIYMVRSLLIHI